MLSRKEAINKIFDRHGDDSIYVTNTGYISRAVYNEYPDNKNIFYMQGSMGLAPCIGLVMAMNTDKDIVVLSGDGALLMHLGITHTIAEQNLANLFVYVLDNGCHESVGGYKCSELEYIYKGLSHRIIGVNEVIKIANDGKTDRVKLDCIKNTNQIKELF